MAKKRSAANGHNGPCCLRFSSKLRVRDAVMSPDLDRQEARPHLQLAIMNLAQWGTAADIGRNPADSDTSFQSVLSRLAG